MTMVDEDQVREWFALSCQAFARANDPLLGNVVETIQMEGSAAALGAVLGMPHEEVTYELGRAFYNMYREFPDRIKAYFPDGPPMEFVI